MRDVYKHAEDIDTFSWIMKYMASIEPHWSLSKIKIIFADGLITQQLITDIKIENACILHGDFHHLFKEVWPNNANFGTVIFSKIKTELKKLFYQVRDKNVIIVLMRPKSCCSHTLKS